MEPNIRPPKPLDVTAIIAMIQKTHRISFGKIYPQALIDLFCEKYAPENFKIKMKTITYLVATPLDSNTILGIIGLKDNQLRTFFVDPDFQGQGIGRKLYNAIEAVAIKRGLHTLILEGSPLGEPIYKHLGFRYIKTLHKQRAGITYTDAYMTKKLGG